MLLTDGCVLQGGITCCTEGSNLGTIVSIADVYGCAEHKCTCPNYM